MVGVNTGTFRKVMPSFVLYGVGVATGTWKPSNSHSADTV